MTMDGLETWTAVLIALTVGASVLRSTLGRWAAPRPARGPLWRFASLLALQGLTGVFLQLTLFPPSTVPLNASLVVATRGAKPPLSAPGDVVVALPEAGKIAGAIRVPDLGSALRLYPELPRLRIEGEGLTPRDQIPLDRPSKFIPPPEARGVVQLTLPGPVAPGAGFTVAGQVGTLTSGVVDLLDPANRVVATAEIKAGQRFNLSAATRAAGPTLFALLLKDSSGRQLERIDIPVEVRAQRPPRVLVLAGAANPEIKHLRRWATDAGIDLSVEIDIGGGVLLGDPSTPLTRAGLGETDLAVIDDRRWETLSQSSRGVLQAAVGDGLGLLLRPSGPLSSTTRRDWAALGLATVGDDDVEALSLEGAAATTALELRRYGAIQAGRDGVPIIRDKAGAALAVWRSRGQGRVGLWIVADSYALALAGQSDRHGDLWSELVSTLARPGEGLGARASGITRPGERTALCQVTGQVRVIDPEGLESRPQVDPATGHSACAAYWPRRAGWHRVLNGGPETAFYVHPADAAPSLAQSASRQATQERVEAAAQRQSQALSHAPGSPWPWAAGLLILFGLLWWLERRMPLPGHPRSKGGAE